MVKYAYIIFYSTIMYSVLTFLCGRSSLCTEPSGCLNHYCQTSPSVIIGALDFRTKQDCGDYLFQASHFQYDAFEIQRSDVIKDTEQLGEMQLRLLSL